MAGRSGKEGNSRRIVEVNQIMKVNRRVQGRILLRRTIFERLGGQIGTF
jgi:hypothetical protein